MRILSIILARAGQSNLGDVENDERAREKEREQGNGNKTCPLAVWLIFLSNLHSRTILNPCHVLTRVSFSTSTILSPRNKREIKDGWPYVRRGKLPPLRNPLDTRPGSETWRGWQRLGKSSEFGEYSRSGIARTRTRRESRMNGKKKRDKSRNKDQGKNRIRRCWMLTSEHIDFSLEGKKLQGFWRWPESLSGSNSMIQIISPFFASHYIHYRVGR